MATKWTKVRAAYDLLKDRNGCEVTAQQIADATQWKLSTAKSYITKRWAGILTPKAKHSYEIHGMENITWDNFKDLHSQVIVPSKAPTPSKYDYDVALSFAGEDREYVEKVAELLKSYDIPIFYDAYESTTLWGKDLYLHLDEVYRVRSKFYVMFLSRDYAKKLWTNHEMKSAQARAFEERGEYLLPVKIDDTEIPGIRATISYLDARKYNPTELANIIAEKLGHNIEFKNMMAILYDYLGDDYKIEQDGAYIYFDCPTEDFQTSYSTKMLIEAMKSDRLDHILLGLFV